MGYFNSLDISASALTAQRLRMDVISQNIANSSTTRSADGKPYRRKVVLFGEREAGMPFSDMMAKQMGTQAGSGVRVTGVIEDKSPYRKVYDPSHPDADENGYVSMPNVDVVTEMINMISASRAYEANVTAINTSKTLAMKALDIGR